MAMSTYVLESLGQVTDGFFVAVLSLRWLENTNQRSSWQQVF